VADKGQELHLSEATKSTGKSKMEVKYINRAYEEVKRQKKKGRAPNGAKIR